MKIEMLKATAPVVGDRISNVAAGRTFQSTVTGTGQVSATVIIEGSNDLVAWVTLATLSPSGASPIADAAVSNAAWPNVRARVTAISGTNAQVAVTLGAV